ncbi:MAG: porin family protein [Cellvibrio sp.]|jgi:hypothetical protein|nr:porin family protein [Cellvibrio sp.]MDF3014256.1 porin family protein [Cellvibrio sp.]
MKYLVAAVLSLAAVSAIADTQSRSGFYAGANLVEVDGNDDIGRWTAIEAVGGYKLNSFVGGEIRLGGAGDSEPNLDAYSSIYYRTESANDTTKAYLLAGYTVASFSGEGGGSEDFDGFSYGAGAGFVINRSFMLNFEVRQLLKDNDADLDLTAFSVGFDYRF